MFLALYYAVLVQRNPWKITFVEILMYIWIAAFAYDEFGEFRDAGTLFYAADFWSLWDIGIVGIGVAFLAASRCSQSTKITGLLALQDLFSAMPEMFWSGWMEDLRCSTRRERELSRLTRIFT